MKKIILPVSITLISILLIGCAQTAPQDTPAPEETATHEPVLLLCSVCDEMKVEDEHCHDWQAEMIERNNAERAERERQAEIDAANEAAYEAARLEAWNTLPEDEREEWMAQARADAMQWWEDLIQEEYDVMIATGWVFSPYGESFHKAAPPPEHIKLTGFSDDYGAHEGFWVRVLPELLSPDNGIIYINAFRDNHPWEYILALGFADFSVSEYSYGSYIIERFGELIRVTKGYGGGYEMFEGAPFETMVVPLSYELCITDRMWTPECVCEMPPDFQP